MRRSVAAIVCILGFTVASCASTRTNLTDTGAVDVKIDDAPASPVQHVKVYLDTDDDETVIRGKVFHSDAPFYPRYGQHVHVTVTSPDGQVIAEERPQIIWQTGPRGKRGSPTASTRRTGSGRFTVRLPEVVPFGTVVEVVYHDSPHRNASAG
jgi:hypothetical protein